jgi:hypothetical protein
MGLAVAFADEFQAAKPQPPPTPQARVTFADFPGVDDFTSDGLGPYWDDPADGIKPYSIFRADLLVGSSNDLSLVMVDDNRKFWGQYFLIGCGPVPSCQPLPSGTFQTGSAMRVRKIADMLPGTTEWTQANFSVRMGRATWTFWWCNSGAGSNPPAGVNVAPVSGECVSRQHGSQMVSVRRVDSAATAWPADIPTWILSSDPAQDPSGYVGNTSELSEYTNNPTNFLNHGLYKARVDLMIECVSSCDRLATP